MTAPYAPSQLSLSNFDASQAATATWLFSSPDSSVGQESFEVKIINNATGAVVLDTGVISSVQTQYTIPPNTLVNRTEYQWQVQYTDTDGNVSPWSTLAIFICSAAPVTAISVPANGATITGNTLSIQANYSQAQGVAQQSYRIVVYANDQSTVIQDTGTLLSSANQQTFYGLTSGNYYVQSIVTSADGLTGTSPMSAFTVNYTGGAQTPNITATPLPEQAAIRLDWKNDRQIPGTYVPASGTPTFTTGIWGQAVNVSKHGEKVYWPFAPETQFTYGSWFIPNMDSSAFTASQVLAHLRLDEENFLQMRYDSTDSTFVLEKIVNGSGIVAKSQNGLTFSAGDHLFLVIQQSTAETLAYIGVDGSWYPIQFGTAIDASATYGVATYGVNSYSANDPGLVTIEYAYVGCTPTDGWEANSLFDETFLTLDILSGSALQDIYTNATQQTFGTETIFLAEFDGNLVGGQTSTALASWNITRIANGISKLIANIPYDDSLQTATYTDFTPLCCEQYTYEIASVDVDGNVGHDPVVNSSVVFDGWWLTDPDTQTTFQFYYMVPDVGITKNYGRTEYNTFYQYPIVAKTPTKYHTGTLGAWVIDTGTGKTPFQQYQELEAMIDNNSQLILRGDEGQGMLVDCYSPQDTVPNRNHKQYDTIQINFTEVGAA